MSGERSSDQLPDDPSLSALYRRTRQERPTAELDQAVMQEARRALSRRRVRWWLPLSTAAVILLGVSLTLNQMEPPGYPEPDVEMTKESQPSAAVPAPATEIAPKKMMKSAPAPGLQQAVPARQRFEADGMLFDTPMQMEMEEAASATQADDARQLVPPARQVSEMLELLRQGDSQELLKVLRVFRASHPDYPLPEALAEFEAVNR